MTSIASYLRYFLKASYVRSASARSMSLIAQFVLIYVASRATSPDVFGEFTTILSASLFAGIYFSMGQIGATYRALPKLVKENAKEELSGELSKVISLYFYFIPFLVIPLSFFLFFVPTMQKVLLYVVLAGAIIAILETLSVVLRSYNSIFMSDFCKNTVWRISFIFMILIYLALTPQWALSSLKVIFLLSLFIGLVTALISTIKTSKPNLKILPFSQSRDKLKIDSRRWVISVFNTLFSSLDVVAVGVLIGLVEAGVYFIVVRMASIPGLILSVTNPVIVPVISRISQGENSKELRKLVKRNTFINVVTTLLLCLLIYLFRDKLFLLLSGYQKDISIVLLFLILGQLINASVGPTVLASQIFDIQKETILLIALSFIVFLIGIFGLVPRFGIVGMAITVLLIRVIQNIGIAVLLRVKAGFSIFTGDLIVRRP